MDHASGAALQVPLRCPRAGRKDEAPLLPLANANGTDDRPEAGSLAATSPRTTSSMKPSARQEHLHPSAQSSAAKGPERLTVEPTSQRSTAMPFHAEARTVVMVTALAVLVVANAGAALAAFRAAVHPGSRTDDGETL